jgi:hypothetical protein
LVASKFSKEFQQNKIVGDLDMDRYSRLQWTARVGLVLLAVFCISTLGMARQDILDKSKDVIIDKPAEGVKNVFDDDDNNYREKPGDSQYNSCGQTVYCPSKEKPACPSEEKRECPATCASQGTPENPLPVTIDDLRHHGECYYGKTVTTEGKIDDTYSDNAFTIKGHGHEVLVISDSGMCDSVVPLKGEVKEGKPVRITAVVEPFDESKLCTLGLEGVEKHLSKSPMLMVKKTETAKVEEPTTVAVIEMPAPAPPPMPEAAPAPEPAPAPPAKTELPRTASDVPLVGIGGLFALGVAFAVRRFRTE